MKKRRSRKKQADVQRDLCDVFDHFAGVEAARYLDSLACLTNGYGTPQARESLLQDARAADRFIRWRLASLKERMRVELDRGVLKDIARIPKKVRFAVLRSAYLRDLLLQLLLEIREFAARRRGDDEKANRFAKLREVWSLADKGRHLARTSAGREALTLLRQLYVYTTFTPLRTESLRAKQEAELSKPLLDAAKSEQDDFELAFARAKKLRAKRRPATLTEEGDLRADLTFFGVFCQLFDKKPPKPQELMKAFAPHIYATLLDALKEGDEKRVKNIERNWRKLLNETQILRKKKRGRPRKGTD
jgi:hypothetical protein